MTESETLRVQVVCPYHGEVLKSWRAFLHDDATRAHLEAKGIAPERLNPSVITPDLPNHGMTVVEVFPPSDWQHGENIPIGLWGTLADVVAGVPGAGYGNTDVVLGVDEKPRHGQVRLRCPRPSCTLDVAMTRDTRERLQELVRELWRRDQRGELQFTPAQLGL